MDLLKILLYILIFAFPLGAVIRIPIATSAFIYPTDIILSFVFIHNVFHVYKTKQIPNKFPFFKPLVLFLSFALISLVLNFSNLTTQEFFVSLMYLLRFILYSQLLFTFSFIDTFNFKKYIFYLSLSGFVTVVLGFFQYVFFPYLGNLYYLGWDKHYFRIFSTFLDPNFAGALFVLQLLLLLQLFQQEYEKKKIKKYFYGAAILLTTGAIFLTYSRSSFIMLFICGITYLILMKQKKIVFLFLMVFILGIVLIPKNLSSEGVDLLRTASVIQRQEAYQHAINIFSQSPIYGVGFNAYRYAQKDQGFLDEKNWESSHSGAGVPNSFLFILATTGIIGFLLFMNFWYRVIVSIKKVSLAPLVVSSIIAIFIHSLFENTLFYPFVMVWIFILIGVTMVDKKL